jgi:hypothetical protein
MSLRAAINAHCKWCIYDPKCGLGNWRQQVEACAITRCSLWPVRPTSSGGKVKRGAELAPDQTDPTPWCHQCGARKQAQCGCGPIAENN